MEWGSANREHSQNRCSVVTPLQVGDSHIWIPVVEGRALAYQLQSLSTKKECRDVTWRISTTVRNLFWRRHGLNDTWSIPLSYPKGNPPALLVYKHVTEPSTLSSKIPRGVTSASEVASPPPSPGRTHIGPLSSNRKFRCYIGLAETSMSLCLDLLIYKVEIYIVGINLMKTKWIHTELGMALEMWQVHLSASFDDP